MDKKIEIQSNDQVTRIVQVVIVDEFQLTFNTEVLIQFIYGAREYFKEVKVAEVHSAKLLSELSVKAFETDSKTGSIEITATNREVKNLIAFIEARIGHCEKERNSSKFNPETFMTLRELRLSLRECLLDSRSV